MLTAASAAAVFLVMLFAKNCCSWEGYRSLAKFAMLKLESWKPQCQCTLGCNAISNNGIIEFKVSSPYLLCNIKYI